MAKNILETTKGQIKFSKKSYGYVVREGKFVGVGSAATLEELKARIEAMPATKYLSSNV